MDFRFEKITGLTLPEALSLEWLETNGLGGYASSTILNCQTRKYHGLLVSNLKHHAGKYVLLSQLDDSLIMGDSQYPLTAHQYTNILVDSNFSYFQSFELYPHPKITYSFEEKDCELTKEWMLVEGEDTILIKYQLEKGKEANLLIKPLIAFRNFHELTRQNSYLKTQLTDCPNGKSITPYEGLPTIYFQTNSISGTLSESPTWYYNFDYEQEKRRGYPSQEDLFSPLSLSVSLTKDQPLIFCCSLSEQDPKYLVTHWKNESQRRRKFSKELPGRNAFQQQLKKVAPSFVHHNYQLDGLSITAGYPWFEDCGRDAMTALPGLTLSLGRERECLEILRNFTKVENKGLLPNFFGQTIEDNNYNAVDVSLWFGWAVQQYYTQTHDLNSIEKYLWPTLKNIFGHYKTGTYFDIHMQKNGLLWAGNCNTNLTWMDVKIDGVPVNARYGLAVEVNALWFNLICFMNILAKNLHDPIEQELQFLIQTTGMAFREVFWDESLGYLKDCVQNEGFDASIRPNQILAVSLPYSALTKNMAIRVIQVVKDHLLTPYGLRSLSPQDPRYNGHYEGNERSRDLSYHNGTVWPWLLGHFGVALLRISESKKEVVKVLTPCFKALEAHLSECGLGTISEVFDGDAPYKPNGCISQAWNIAELLRLIMILRA